MLANRDALLFGGECSNFLGSDRPLVFPPELHHADERALDLARAQEPGDTLSEVKELLALRSGGGRSCKQVRTTASAKIADIEARIASLKRIRRALAKLAHECDAGRGGCPLLEYLEGKL